MQKCPNCGRATARTDDWACQYCGYPLLSESYKKIPMSYRQLQEQKLYNLKLEPEPVAEAEPVPELERGPVVEPERKPEPEPEVTVEPEREPMPEPEPVAEVEPEAVSELEREPVVEPEAERKPEPEPEVTVEPEREPLPKPEPVAEVEPEPVSELEREPVVEPEAERKPEPEPEVTVEPEPKPLPEPEPVAEAEPERDPTLAVIEMTAEGLFSAYKADEAAADAKFANKILKVTGIADRIVVNSVHDVYYIMLTGAVEKEVWSVRCGFDKKQGPKLDRLTTGQTVTVQGEYDGYKRNILMRDCILVD